MVNMVQHEAFACRCAEGDVVLQQSYKPESYGKLYYELSKILRDTLKHFQVILWYLQRLQVLSLGPSTPTNYSLGSSRNRECSNCKHLRGKISVLKATMEMHMHPEQHTVNSAALFHEVLNEMEKLDLE
ncbi:hypothetical protein Tco_0582976 [Tanacetum coccineum]